MSKFKLVSDFKPCGDQPQAIDALTKGVLGSLRYQTLLGVTGSGKTFTIANVIANVNKPTLVISHNKTLAAQLYSEFKEFFPKNKVEYFVSYYDYYQPEAYVPQTDIYIEKDASINAELDALRLSTTSSLVSREDVIIVASVSCIYNLGSPEDYRGLLLFLEEGQIIPREDILSRLIEIQYDRNDFELQRGRFRARGDVVEIFPAYEEITLRIELLSDTIERISEVNPLTGEVLRSDKKVAIYPAKHFLVNRERIETALKSIEWELEDCLRKLRQEGKLLEAQRLESRTRYDMEMLREMGYCHGIENYSRHLSGRVPGSRPFCLIDYFPNPVRNTKFQTGKNKISNGANPVRYANLKNNKTKLSNGAKDFLTIIDESHVTVPQLRGMYEGDKSRKEVLVEYGFRLPSCLDNRPLKFEEFEGLINQVIFVSATPANYEISKSGSKIIEQIVRPTGLVDPEIIIKPAQGQIEDLIAQIKMRAERKERTLVTTLTKRMAEDLSAYLEDMGIRVRYLHSEIKPIDRVEILKALRLMEFDCLVGINLLREGLDLPEVSLVAVLDADKEGFLRSEVSLIQVAGRAARNINGQVIMYADNITESMKRAIEESERRRKKQLEFNKKYGITPRSIQKAIREGIETTRQAKKLVTEVAGQNEEEYELDTLIAELEHEMELAARNLQFEQAAVLRDQIKELKSYVVNKKPNPK